MSTSLEDHLRPDPSWIWQLSNNCLSARIKTFEGYMRVVYEALTTYRLSICLNPHSTILHLRPSPKHSFPRALNSYNQHISFSLSQSPPDFLPCIPRIKHSSRSRKGQLVNLTLFQFANLSSRCFFLFVFLLQCIIYANAARTLCSRHARGTKTFLQLWMPS